MAVLGIWSGFTAVLRIRDILVRIRMRMRILGSVPLTNGSYVDPGGPKTYGFYVSGSGTLVYTYASFFKE